MEGLDPSQRVAIVLSPGSSAAEPWVNAKKKIAEGARQRRRCGYVYDRREIEKSLK
jgi:hypothetical protein